MTRKIGPTRFLVGVVVGVLAGSLGGAGAQMPDAPARARFGMMGIGKAQTARLSVVATTVPPSPCVLTLRFLDDEGDPIGDREEQGLQATLDEEGESVFLDLVEADVMAPGTRRLQVRPAVEYPPTPCDEADLVSTVEIFGGDGRTSVGYGNPGPPN